MTWYTIRIQEPSGDYATIFDGQSDDVEVAVKVYDLEKQGETVRVHRGSRQCYQTPTRGDDNETE